MHHQTCLQKLGPTNFFSPEGTAEAAVRRRRGRRERGPWCEYDIHTHRSERLQKLAVVRLCWACISLPSSLIISSSYLALLQNHFFFCLLVDHPCFLIMYLSAKHHEVKGRRGHEGMLLNEKA